MYGLIYYDRADTVAKEISQYGNAFQACTTVSTTITVKGGALWSWITIFHDRKIVEVIRSSRVFNPCVYLTKRQRGAAVGVVSTASKPTTITNNEAPQIRSIFYDNETWGAAATFPSITIILTTDNATGVYKP